MFPPVPAFYAKLDSLEAMVDQTVGRVLDLFGSTRRSCGAGPGFARPPRTEPSSTAAAGKYWFGTVGAMYTAAFTPPAVPSSAQSAAGAGAFPQRQTMRSPAPRTVSW